MKKVRQRTQVNHNTEDRILYTCRTVPCDVPDMTEPKQCCRRQHFPLQCYGRHQLLYQTNTVRLPPRAPEASTVLWAPAFTVPGEHGKTPYMPLGINNVAGTDIYHT